jgi:hypothetical protein
MITTDTATLLTAILPDFDFILKKDLENVDFKDVDSNFNNYEYDLVNKTEYEETKMKKGIKAKLNNGYFILKEKQ